jgi:hypothetical protein
MVRPYWSSLWRVAAILLVVGVVLHILPEPIHACTCPGDPEWWGAEQYLEEYDAVFVGRIVAQIAPTSLPTEEDTVDRWPIETYEVAVEHIYKGPRYETVYISDSDAGLCGFYFGLHAGDAYLFYVDTERWWVGLCNPSLPLSMANAHVAELDMIVDRREPELDTAAPYPTPTPNRLTIHTPVPIEPTPTLPHTGGCALSPGADLITVGLMAGIVGLALRRPRGR